MGPSSEPGRSRSPAPPSTRAESGLQPAAAGSSGPRETLSPTRQGRLQPAPSDRPRPSLNPDVQVSVSLCVCVCVPQVANNLTC